MPLKRFVKTSFLLSLLVATQPAEARLSPSFCSEMRDAMRQMNSMLPQTIERPSPSLLQNLRGFEEKIFLNTTYLSVDVDCEEEAVIYNVRIAEQEVEAQLKSDSRKAESAFYDMHENQKAMACRPSGFIRKFGLKQEVRTLLDRSGDVWHRWVTSSYDCR